MGYNPQVYLLDYNKYLTRLVPAFHKLLLTGQLEPWLTPTFTACMAEILDYAYTAETEEEDKISLEQTLALISQPDLFRYCTFLNPKDLALADYARYANNLLFLNYMSFSCESTSCPLRTSCFMYKNRSPQNAPKDATAPGWRAGVNYTFEKALLEQCADSQFKHSLGRSYKVGFYEQHLKNAGFEAYTHPAYSLLTALSGRGGALGFADQGEGLLGWLDPTETGELVGYLNQLADLLEIEPTIEAMRVTFESFTPSPASREFNPNPFENKQATPYRFASLSLGVLRTLGQLAVEQGWGLVLHAW